LNVRKNEMRIEQKREERREERKAVKGEKKKTNV
jgi:hypothetical protein